MKKIILIFSTFFLILFFNCSNPEAFNEESGGNIVIQTPSVINPPMFNIMSNSNSQIQVSSLNQDNFRYQITVESRGKRLLYTVLKRSDKKAISVISGIPLDIYVSVYYAMSSSSNDEQYNVFLASDSVTDFTIMKGESKKLALELDLTKRLPVDTYFNTGIFGSRSFASITGAAFAANPTFSVKPYDSATSKLINVPGTFDTPATGITHNGRGVLTKLDYDPAGTYWYVQRPNQAVYRSLNGFNSYTTNNITIPSGCEALENTLSIKNATVTHPFAASSFYNFIIHNNGYFGTYSTGVAFSPLSNVNTTNFNNTYPADPYILDIKHENLYNKVFFATKSGLFYVNEATTQKYAQGELDQAISASKKMIRIQESGRNILATKIAMSDSTSDSKKVFIGTKKGIYSLDRTSSAWNTFYNTSDTTSTEFDQDSITKLALDEPVKSMKVLAISVNTVNYNILYASTPKRIWFYNIKNGRSASMTVWDGLPFIPAYGSGLPAYNTLEYKVHDAAPVNEIIYDGRVGYNKFWIATDFGLASVNFSSLGL